MLIWVKNCPIFCSKLPRSQKWRYQEFLLHQKMAKEGSKNQKKIFFQKKYSKDGKKNFGTSRTIISFFRKSPEAFRTLTLPPLPASDRPTVTSHSHSHVTHKYCSPTPLSDYREKPLKRDDIFRHSEKPFICLTPPLPLPFE